jgi:hypothetical protein
MSRLVEQVDKGCPDRDDDPLKHAEAERPHQRNNREQELDTADALDLASASEMRAWTYVDFRAYAHIQR